MSDFESAHPRGPGGKFSSKGGALADAAKKLEGHESEKSTETLSRLQSSKSETKDGSQYSRVSTGETVDGLVVNEHIPNLSSIGASVENHTTLGVRELPMSDFGGPKSVFYAKNDFEHSARLAEEIKASGVIAPLIVVVDKEGPYILEGAHRFVALHNLGKKSFPALVVRDDDAFE
jgi:hypothetical protein